MTFIALDDEPLALVLIEKFAEAVPEAKLLSTFTDAKTAANFLKNNPVDLLLSDIHMPDISGLQFVRDLPDERPMVIFVTAHKEYAHEGFDLDVVDYLVKPLSPERFKKAIGKATDLLKLREIAEQATAVPAPAETHFFVFSEYQQIKINIADIRYIESMGDYVKIHLVSQKHPVLTLERLKNLNNRLAPHGFRRIHRSFLVNQNQITARQKSKVLMDNVWLPVGETFAE